MIFVQLLLLFIELLKSFKVLYIITSLQNLISMQGRQEHHPHLPLYMHNLIHF